MTETRTIDNHMIDDREPDNRTSDRRQPLERLIGILPAVVISIAYLAVHPTSTDFSSGDFRARLFRDGAYVWNLRWFAGHPLPGYGLVSPMLGAAFGVVPIALASMLVATCAFDAILTRCVAEHRTLRAPTAATALFAIGCGLTLWGGRLTFGPAVAFGTVSILCLQRRRLAVAVLAAALCGLSSPVGALSLVVVAAACWAARSFPRRDVALVAGACVIPPMIIGLIFPEGGWYPFPGGSLLMLTISLALVGWFGRHSRTVRVLVGVYAAVAIIAFVIRSPLGGNIVRLAWLAAGPTAVLTFHRFRRTLLPMFVTMTLIWGWSYVKLGLAPAAASASPRYYDPLAAFVLAQPGATQRVEVVPTTSFQQADALALKIVIARGWEAQLDRALNPEFYDNLTSDSYHRWLLRNAVGLVALPTSSVQLSSRNEQAIIESAPPYLHLVWSTPEWRVFRVVDAVGLADHGATVTHVGTQMLTVHATESGVVTVRFRYTKWFRVTSGAACVESTPDGWTRLVVARPGDIVLDASFTLDAVLGDQDACATI
ncbi:MAG: hypothetical protein JWM34_195 [Ilumatobacteraceae bacterium]|nr:hypothetical protein [Ilumatobacteraceae bacterium]